jgi:hypothetical protein
MDERVGDRALVIRGNKPRYFLTFAGCARLQA